MVQTLSHYKYIKEVKNDPKLGVMLVVNFNPYKVCSFNCIFCGIGPTTDKICERECFYPPEEIFAEIRDYIENNEQPNYAWLTGLGEPTLYSGFRQLSKMIKNFYPKLKIGVSSNGSLLNREDVRDDFNLCDFIIINLNSVFPEEFSKICRHHENIELNNIINGIISFRENFAGIFGITTIFIRGINDNLKNLNGLKEVIFKIMPDLFILKNYACKGYRPITDKFKSAVKTIFSDFPNEIVFKY
jgi:wyosine [tRNA(Phe)-imidazoG37] synthetase (radical SAM superfamily)